MLNYITNFYMDWVSGHVGAQKVPPVFPILLYNGDARWTAAQEMGEYGIGFRYFKIAENEYSAAQLLGIQNIVSTLFLAESRYDIDALAEQLLALFEREEDKRAVSLFLNWFRQLAEHGRIAQDDYGTLETVYRSREEVQSMLISKLEQWKQGFYREGREEGRKEGRRELILAMHARNLDAEMIAELTGLAVEEVETILAQAANDNRTDVIDPNA